MNLSTNGSVTLNIQIADSIAIRTWNKNEAYVRATVNVNDNKDNDYYKWNFDEGGGNLNVKAQFDYPKRNCDCNTKSEINCVVYIPEKTNLTVETISGNITITGQTAEVKAKSISGFVDMTVSPQRAAQVKLSTITGRMYSDLELETPDQDMRKVGGNTINSTLNGGGVNAIQLDTISGDIFFHKS